MSHSLKKFVAQVAVISVALSFALGINYISAWVEPPSDPPGGNVPTPVNVGLTTQSKSGALAVFNNFYANRIGINVSPPVYSLDIGTSADSSKDCIRFRDGTLQCTAASGGGGGGGGFTVLDAGYIVYNGISGPHSVNLGTDWELILLEGARSEDDDSAVGGYVYRQGGSPWAVIHVKGRMRKFIVEKKLNCINTKGVTTSGLCVNLDASGNLVISIGGGDNNVSTAYLKLGK